MAGIATRCAVALAALLVLAAPGAAFADWPVYGHDLANSRNARKAGPPKGELPSLQQAWKFNSPTGDFTGTPVVAGGTLVAGDNGGSVYALSPVTGKLLWSRRVGQPINGSAAIDTHAPGGPAVFVPVAQSGRPRLLALSLRDGTVRWDKVLTTQANANVFGSPVFWDGTVYIGTSGPNNDNTHARGSVVALDEKSGDTRWQTFTVPPGHDGAAVWTTPAIDTATGRLYVGTGNNYHEPSTETEDSILALDAASGRIVGDFQATANDTFSLPDNPAGGPDADFGSSPNLFRGPGGEKLVGEGQKSGTYWALDRARMRPVWQAQAGPGSQVGGFLGSTAYDGSRIYGANTVSGQVVAIGRDGSMPWQSLDAGGVHWSPTTVANGVLYTMGPAGFLTARDPVSGSIITELPLGGPSFGGVAAAGRAIYVSVGTGPPPAPAPQQDGQGAIVAFGDTSPAAANANRPSTFNGSCKVATVQQCGGAALPQTGIDISLQTTPDISR
jgi:polyvinyl alcohol dehydrogenase (cytochrome)